MRLSVLFLLAASVARAQAVIPCDAVMATKDGMWCQTVPSPTPTPVPTPTPCVPLHVDGLRVDKCDAPMTQSDRPAYLVPFTDPVFGTKVTRISAAAEYLGGEGAVIKPAYSTMQAWNADESLLILWQRAGGGRVYHLLDGERYTALKTLDIPAADFEQIMWDPVDPRVFYYPSNVGGRPTLRRYDVTTDATTTLRDFAAECGGIAFGNRARYLSWASADLVVGMRCGDVHFTYSITKNQILGGLVSPAGGAPGWGHPPLIAPSGTRFVWGGAVYDAAYRKLRDLAFGAWFEHESMGQVGGRDVNARVVYDPPEGQDYAGNLVFFDLETGTPVVAIGPRTGYPYPRVSTHVSAIAHRAPHRIAVGMIGDPAGTHVLDQEVVVYDANAGHALRAGHVHSVAGEAKGETWGYWAETHVVISPTGTRVLFASDWGTTVDGVYRRLSVDTYVVDLRK